MQCDVRHQAGNALAIYFFLDKTYIKIYKLRNDIY